MKTLLLFIGLLGALTIAPSSIPDHNTVSCLPCTFDNELISCVVHLDGSDSLVFYTDTGGKNFFYKSALKKLHLNLQRNDLWEKSYIEGLLMEQNFPVPLIKQFYYIKEKSEHHDGMLGREWFADKCWTFDYGQQTLSVHDTFGSGNFPHRHSIKMHLKKDAEGNHNEHLGRIEVIIDSDTLSFLFDTGAQAHLSTDAQEQLQERHVVATSFISASIFHDWEQNHPDWPIIRAADQSFGKGADMIIVPEVTVGTRTIGPVEFVKREDANFDLMTELFMDEAIIGALGGNFLAQISPFTVDYLQETIWIRR